MALARRVADLWTMYGYSVEEVARFLQYDEAAIRYWLRTGHLSGRLDPRTGDWRVTPGDLVTFLRQTSEPMPTGVVAQPTAPPADALPASVAAIPNDIIFSSDSSATVGTSRARVELARC